MEKTELPSKLVSMARARRLIPFIGAGFSATLNLPDWDNLLRRLSEDIDSPLAYQEVKDYCNNDMLQIAEYYLLISDGRVGPMRHAISTSLQITTNPLMSGPHIELVNLGCPQIYTTNFDESIEKTFRALKLPVEVVSLPKHLAISSDAKTQVVKYHGDLRYDQTLVLTESNYYARLDLESPMDIKFRSDLLGRSVLFIGYSFRDINIRIIWFKLKRMMTDIPDEDSPTSFIVTFNPNPVLEALYAAVGIETICLDPKKQAANSVAKSALLSDFMLRLANATATSGHIPGNPGHSLFFSSAISDAVAEVLTEEEKVDPHLRGRFSRTRLNSLYTEISKRVIPDCYQQSVRSLLSSESIPVSSSVVSAALRYFHQFGPESFVTSICLKGLERSEPRRALLGAVVDWKRILAVKLPRSYLDGFLMRFEQEFRYHEPKAQVGPGPDYDIGFFTDIAKRILRGEIIDEIPEDDRQKLSELLERATRLYPALASYRPPTDAPPSSDSISRAILSAKSEAGVTTDDVLF